ncbi:MAG: hypothetical protein ACWA66_15490 [Methylibium petroleiphilum]
MTRQDLQIDGSTDRIDPDKWNPLIMKFQKEVPRLHDRVASPVSPGRYSRG